MATSGKRNRRAGHDLEKLIAADLRRIGFPHVVTCRAENRNRDGQGVDLINSDELKNGRLEYNIQCKNSTDRPQYDILLKAMPQVPEVINVIIHKYTIRQGSRFVPRGYYAIMPLEHFYQMVGDIKSLESQTGGG